MIASQPIDVAMSLVVPTVLPLSFSDGLAMSEITSSAWRGMVYMCVCIKLAAVNEKIYEPVDASMSG